MKAIILAAGMGTRLGKYTENLPKCMLEFNGKPLIQYQVETLRKAGITDVSIVRGYHPEKINIEGVKYYQNYDYATTNMVESLFCAQSELDEKEDILVCYADIIYELRILKKVIESKNSIGVVVDQDYWPYWEARSTYPENDMESLIIKNNKIIELGNPKCQREEAEFRYVGLIKFSKKAIKALKETYHDNRQKYYHQDIPWLRSKSFKKAYMTCMLQALINAGNDIEPIIVSKGWLEFDTEEDYEKYQSWKKNNTLQRFISLT